DAPLSACCAASSQLLSDSASTSITFTMDMPLPPSLSSGGTLATRAAGYIGDIRALAHTGMTGLVPGSLRTALSLDATMPCKIRGHPAPRPLTYLGRYWN